MIGLVLRAYPRRWRAVRGGEVRALLEDLGPLSAGQAPGLVRGGVATRWRTRPPWRVVATFRLLGRRPADRYDVWLRDDLDGYLFAVREGLWMLVLLSPALLAIQLWFGWFTPLSLTGAVVLNAIGDEVARRRLRESYFSPRRDEIGHFQPYRGMTQGNAQ